MKSFKRLGAIAGILILIGCVLIGVGFANGGSIAHKGFGFYMPNGYFLGMNFGQDAPEDETPKKTKRFTYQNVTDLDVSMEVGTLIVNYSDTIDTLTVECKNISNRNIKYSQEGERLEFEVYSPNSIISFNHPDYTVIVTIPSNQKLNVLDISSDTGNIQADTLSANSIEVSSDTGNIEVGELAGDMISLSVDTGRINANKVTCKNLNIESDTGNAKVFGIDCVQMTAENDTGSMKLEGKISKLMKLENDTGMITLDLIGKENQYGYKISNDIGSVKFGNAHFGMDESHTQSVTTGAMAEITNDVGSVTVTFREK